MSLLLLFSITLLAAVFISARARKGILSTAVLFLGSGVAAGAFGLLPQPNPPATKDIAELALVATLFTDGAKIEPGELRGSLRLPGRALLLGLPLTLLSTAVLGHFLVGLDWLPAFVVGAALSPTDPVFAATIVGSERVPKRLRRLLNLESGLNDGLAVPIVLVLLAKLGSGGASLPVLFGQVLAGAAIGVVVPLVAVWVYRRGPFEASATYRPMFALSVLLLAWSLAKLTSTNDFLAAFFAGATLAFVSEKAKSHWEAPGEAVTELLKLAAILVFGSGLLRGALAVGWAGWLFAAAALLVARPASMAVALFRSELTLRERVVAGWFGPRGFASVVFALLIGHSGAPGAQELVHLVSIVVAASIVLHSTTDTVMARWIGGAAGAREEAHAQPA